MIAELFQAKGLHPELRTHETMPSLFMIMTSGMFRGGDDVAQG